MSIAVEVILEQLRLLKKVYQMHLICFQGGRGNRTMGCRSLRSYRFPGLLGFEDTAGGNLSP